MKKKVLKILVLTVIIACALVFTTKKVFAENKASILYYSTYNIEEYTGKSVKLSYLEVYGSDGNKLEEHKDYTVSYENNINAGKNTAIAKIKGIGKYEGSERIINFSILKKIENTTVTEVSNCEYTGKEIKPKVEVKDGNNVLKENVDYEISYNTNINVGSAYFNITGKGLYQGTKYQSFMIIPRAPKNLKASIKYNGIKLTWNKVDECDMYYIYRANLKSGAYGLIWSIDKSKDKNTSFVDQNAETGKKYYYKVVAVKTGYGYSGIESKDSNKVSQYWVQRPTLSIKSYNDKAELSWKKINKASGYIIKRATSKDGNYKTIATIKNGSTVKYIDKKIKSKKQYFYKISTYMDVNEKRIESSLSSAKEKSPYAKTTLTAKNNSSKSITLEWTKVSGVDGYEIYRADTYNGKLKKIKTIKGGSKVSYTEKITKGKAYVYQVRAYANKNGKKLYGQKSSKKKVVTGTRVQQMNKLKLNPDTKYKHYEKIVKKITKNKKTTYDKLKACYEYVIKNMDHDVSSCVQFNGVFVGYARWLGLDARLFSGSTLSTKGDFTVHTWTQININGKEYVFDTSVDKHIANSLKKKVYFDRFFRTLNEVKGKYRYDSEYGWYPYFMIDI